MRVAVLYSGRFYGTATPNWFANQLQNLIIPNNASVFFVSDVQNWCNAPANVQTALAEGSAIGFLNAAREFEDQVRRQFAEWGDVHAMLLPETHKQGSALCDTAKAFGQDAWWYTMPEVCRVWPNVERSVFMVQRRHANQNIKPMIISPHLGVLMVRWYLQMDHLARAEDLRRAAGPHDVIVRARLDLVLPKPLRLVEGRYSRMWQHMNASSIMFAYAFRAVNYDGYNLRNCQTTDTSDVGEGSCEVFFHDWIYFGTPLAFRALAGVHWTP